MNNGPVLRKIGPLSMNNGPRLEKNGALSMNDGPLLRKSGPFSSNDGRALIGTRAATAEPGAKQEVDHELALGISEGLWWPPRITAD